MKEEKSSKYKVVWLSRDGVVSKLDFAKFIPAHEFAQSLKVLAHVYRTDTFEIVGVNKYSKVKFNATR